MENKMTKVMWYDELIGIVEGSDYADKSGAVEFLEAQKALIVNKAAKAKERAAEKKAEGDELRGLVESALTDELQSAGAILESVSEYYPEATRAKVTARLTQLCKANIAYKEQITVDGKKAMHYRLATAADSVDAE